MTTPLDDQATQLHKAVTALVQRYQFRDRDDICCYGISPSQCYTLNALHEHGMLLFRELPDALKPQHDDGTIAIATHVTNGLVPQRTRDRARRVVGYAPCTYESSSTFRDAPRW